MTNPRAFLYGPRGPISRAGGVLAAPQAAVFAPWPRTLDPQTPFLVRIVADDGAEEWAQPLEVELPRPDATGRDALGLVVLRQTSAFPIENGPAVTPRQLTDALQKQSAAAVLPTLGARRFGPLATRTRAPAAPGATTATPTLPGTYTVRNRADAAQVAFSICRIFRWD